MRSSGGTRMGHPRHYCNNPWSQSSCQGTSAAALAANASNLRALPSLLRSASVSALCFGEHYPDAAASRLETKGDRPPLLAPSTSRSFHHQPNCKTLAARTISGSSRCPCPVKGTVFHSCIEAFHVRTLEARWIIHEQMLSSPSSSGMRRGLCRDVA